MQKLFLLIFSALLVLSIGKAQNSEVSMKRAQVMVLGSYHMHNPGADVFNVEADDVLTPTRQAEIMEVVTQLKAFTPTMVGLEIKRGSKRDSTGQADYQAYLKGDFDLTRWEGHQIGYRLAKQLEHEVIFHIDEPGSFPFENLMTYAKENDQMAWLDEMMNKMKKKRRMRKKNQSKKESVRSYSI